MVGSSVNFVSIRSHIVNSEEMKMKKKAEGKTGNIYQLGPSSGDQKCDFGCPLDRDSPPEGMTAKTPILQNSAC
jgi:hypothetical protein